MPMLSKGDVLCYFAFRPTYFTNNEISTVSHSGNCSIFPISESIKSLIDVTEDALGIPENSKASGYPVLKTFLLVLSKMIVL